MARPHFITISKACPLQPLLVSYDHSKPDESHGDEVWDTIMHLAETRRGHDAVSWCLSTDSLKWFIILLPQQMWMMRSVAVCSLRHAFCLHGMPQCVISDTDARWH